MMAIDLMKLKFNVHAILQDVYEQLGGDRVHTLKVGMVRVRGGYRMFALRGKCHSTRKYTFAQASRLLNHPDVMDKELKAAVNQFRRGLHMEGFTRDEDPCKKEV